MIEIDKSLKKSLYSEVCSYCKYFNMVSPLRGNPSCDAFPEGIPQKIFSGKNKHTRPVKGDHGILFNAKE